MARLQKTVFLFPGSGHQYLGMGRDLDAGHRAVRQFLDGLRSALGYDLRETMFDGPIATLMRPLESPTPSLFLEVISALSLAVFHAFEREGVAPDAVAGRSMGEYTALMACGSVSVTDGFALIKRIGAAAQRDCLDFPGELMTVYGLERRQAQGLCREVSRGGAVCELVSHFRANRVAVVGGSADAVELFKWRARELGAERFTPSPEAGAFHTSLMRSHARLMRRELAAAAVRAPRCPIWCNFDGRPARSPAVLRHHLAAQLDHPVKWQEILEGLIARGFEVFVEMAPGRMLTEFLTPLPPRARVLPTDTPENLRAALNFLKPRRKSARRRARA